MLTLKKMTCVNTCIGVNKMFEEVYDLTSYMQIYELILHVGQPF